MATNDIGGIEGALQALSLEKPVPTYYEADILHNPLDVCRSYLAELLCSLVDCEPDIAYRSIQWPNNIFNGDLTVTLPRLRPGVKATEWAPDLMKKFPNDHVLFLPPILDGVHLRIFLSQEVLPRLFVPYILDRTGTYGSLPSTGLRNPRSPEDGQKKLLVESSSPNVTNEFQGKHLRSTILGAFVGKVHEDMGWNVTRINYPGDWGKNIALLKVGWDKFGNEELYQADPIPHLLSVYHQIDDLFQPEVVASRQARDEAARNGQDEGEAQADIEGQGIFAERNAAFKKLEEGDEEALAFWKRIRDVNLETYLDFYSQLGVKFDENSGESQVNTNKMAEIEQMLKDKGICKESAGASVIHMQDYGLKAGTAIVRDRTGATTYLLRDLAAIVERSEQHEFDKMIIVAANDHKAHFAQIHHILIALGMKELADKVQHLHFSEASKMSEKLPKYYKPQAIISVCEEAIDAALKSKEKKAELCGMSSQSSQTLAVAGLFAQELATRTSSAHTFDVSAMALFKAGTGLDLQFWYVELCSILQGHDITSPLSNEDYESLAEDEPVDLLRILLQFPEVTHAVYNSLEPAAIITYLTSLVGQLEVCVNEDEGEDAEEGENMEGNEAAKEKKDVVFTPAQLSLFEAARIVLENGMRLLGITPSARKELPRADTPVAQ